MNFLIKYRLRIGVVVVIIAIASVTLGWYPHKSPSKTSTTGQPTSSTTVKAPDPATKSTIDAGAFTYSKPAGWATITRSVLDTNGSVSGIGRTAAPLSTLFIKISDSVPASNDELVNSVLAAPKILQNFQLISSVATKVNGQSGQKFTYNYTNNVGNKLTSQMNVIVYKQKTYVILFATPSTNYSQQASDFDTILNSFKFK